MKLLRERNHDKVNRIFLVDKKCMLCVTLGVRVSNLFVGVHVS
jgi:hypothetical protein